MAWNTPKGTGVRGSPLGCFTKIKRRRFFLKLSVCIELLNQNYYIICQFQISLRNVCVYLYAFTCFTQVEISKN